MAPVKKVRTAAPARDPIFASSVKVTCTFGDTTIETECALGDAERMAQAMHAVLATIVTKNDSLFPVVQDVHGGSQPYVEDDYAEQGKTRRRVGY